MDKEDVVYTRSRISPSHENEENPAVDHNADEAWEHSAKWNKLVLEGQNPY